MTDRQLVVLLEMIARNIVQAAEETSRAITAKLDEHGIAPPMVKVHLFPGCLGWLCTDPGHMQEVRGEWSFAKPMYDLAGDIRTMAESLAEP